MTQHELQDLSPLIAASEYWAEDPSRPLWLRHEAGRISLALSQPQTLFAYLRTVPDISAVAQDMSEPTVFVEWPSGRHRLHLPTTWDTAAPYEGRPYVLGQYDCYTIVRDWMARARGHEMAMLTDTPERLMNQWLTDGTFVTNPELHRWERVIVPQAGDGILFSLSLRDEDSPNRANHCGVYLGDGRFLHHLPNRASCIQAFDARWRSRGCELHEAQSLMSRTLHADGTTGKVFIYKGDADPAIYASPTPAQLGDLHFHSDLSYLGNTQVLEATVTHPERVRSSSGSKWGGTTYRTRQGTQSFVLGTNTLGAIRPAVAFYGSAQMPAGTVVHKVGQSVRAVSIVVTASQIQLFENWLTFDDTLPAVSRIYRTFVFQTLFTGSGNTSIAIAPGAFTAGFGKLSTSYRYLRRADTLPDAFVTAARTADVQGGGIKVVLPDGTSPVQSDTYTGSFAGTPGTGVRI